MVSSKGKMKNLYSLLIKKNGGRQVRFPLAEAAVGMFAADLSEGEPSGGTPEVWGKQGGQGKDSGEGSLSVIPWRVLECEYQHRVCSALSH